MTIALPPCTQDVALRFSIRPSLKTIEFSEKEHRHIKRKISSDEEKSGNFAERFDANKSSKAPRRRGPKEKIMLSKLVSLYYMPLHEAAKKLGVCDSAVKKFCRRHGISQWPYRQIKLIDEEINNLKYCLSTTEMSTEKMALLHKQIDCLKEERQKIMMTEAAIDPVKASFPLRKLTSVKHQECIMPVNDCNQQDSADVWRRNDHETSDDTKSAHQSVSHHQSPRLYLHKAASTIYQNNFPTTIRTMPQGDPNMFVKLSMDVRAALVYSRRVSIQSNASTTETSPIVDMCFSNCLPGILPSIRNVLPFSHHMKYT